MLTFWMVGKFLGERQYREAAVGVNIRLNGNKTMEEFSVYLDAKISKNVKNKVRKYELHSQPPPSVAV